MILKKWYHRGRRCFFDGFKYRISQQHWPQDGAWWEWRKVLTTDSLAEAMKYVPTTERDY